MKSSIEKKIILKINMEKGMEILSIRVEKMEISFVILVYSSVVLFKVALLLLDLTPA